MLVVPGDELKGYKPTFKDAMLGYPNDDSGWDKLIKVWYFAITTLSTIGFGDFTPVSSVERLLASIILMFGVTVFSFIMGQFIEILMNYKSLWAVGHHKDLSKWIALLSRFNNGNPLNKDLITKIEDFFDYYWEHNRLSALSSESDLRFMEELPDVVQSQIFIDYLFTDFLFNYRTYFACLKPVAGRNRLSGSAIAELKMRNFLVEFVKALEPRFYLSSNDDMIQDQYEEVFEVFYVTKGAVCVGYRLFNEIFYGMRIVMSQEKKIISAINDYSCLHNKCSEFLFMPVEFTEALAMRRENFNEVMEDPVAKKLVPVIAKIYKYVIQQPLHEHRDEMS